MEDGTNVSGELSVVVVHSISAVEPMVPELVGSATAELVEDVLPLSS